MSVSRALLVLASLSPLLAGCPKLAAATRGEAPHVEEARDTLPCVASAEDPKPLVVDLLPEQRGDIEVAMREGIPVVAFDCTSIRVLSGCRAEGSYGFVGFSPKEEVIRLENKDDLRANLPFSSGLLGAKLEGSLGRESTLDVALMMIGKRMSARRVLPREGLHEDKPGACAEATHFVRGATIGAFAIQTVAKGEARTAAELFGVGGLGKVGAGAGSSSEKSLQRSDGTVDACKGADPSAEHEPNGCGALLRLDLVALQGAAAPAPVDALARDMQQDDPCPAGLVFSGGKCTRPRDKAPHLCRQDDEVDCKAQCEAKHTGSCVRLGALLVKQRTGPGLETAFGLFTRACQANDPFGCGWLAELHLAMRKFDLVYADWEKACGLGLSASCAKLGIALVEGSKGSPTAPEKAPPWLERGCDGGIGQACLRLGQLYMMGKVLPQDPPRARAHFERGCEGGSIVSCVQWAMTLREGFGGPKETERAVAVYREACEGGSPTDEDAIRTIRSEACGDLGAIYGKGDGVPKDAEAAKKALARACDLGLPSACRAR